MLANDEVSDDVVKMYQAGKLDAITAMKMLSDFNSQSQPNTPQGTPSPKSVANPPSMGPSEKSSHKRPRETETVESDTDEEMEGEDFKHLDALPIVVHFTFVFQAVIGLIWFDNIWYSW